MCSIWHRVDDDILNTATNIELYKSQMRILFYWMMVLSKFFIRVHTHFLLLVLQILSLEIDHSCAISLILCQTHCRYESERLLIGGRLKSWQFSRQQCRNFLSSHLAFFFVVRIDFNVQCSLKISGTDHSLLLNSYFNDMSTNSCEGMFSWKRLWQEFNFLGKPPRI